MCGRYTLVAQAEELAEAFRVPEPPPALQSRYNIAPTQPVLAVVASGGEREFVLLRWGLVPSWAKNPSVG
ncbi:MAG: SOS response-associated peptidase family protein, partial [Gemmatimonadaceae bacterium]|nr:SOS response-associated peptidase family protein [Gloeobacterales cyanobacterium ES-bin-141]